MDSPNLIRERLETEICNVLIVGHNPYFESLVTELLGLNSIRVQVNVPKASLLRLNKFGGAWQLRDLVTTKVSGSFD